jgi:O-antigen/teichoic acid export membrane protein
MLFTIPISFVLVIVASYIGNNIYHIPEITGFILLMSIILILQGVQGVLGGVYTGLRRFKELYLIQIITAVINVIIFTSFAYLFGTKGFFLAMMLTVTIFVLLLCVFLKKVIGGSLEHPQKADFIAVWKDIFHTGFWTYIARIFSVAWQQAPMLILGKWASPEIVGFYNVALSFGSKLTILASAIGEVNLAFLSNAYARSVDEFKKLSGKTLNEVGVVILFGTGTMALFADVLLKVFAGDAYAPALQVTVLVSWAYAMFAFLDIATNTIFVPTRKAQYRAISFVVLVLVSFGVMFFMHKNPLVAAGYGVLGGAAVALLTMFYFAETRANVHVFSGKLVGVVVCSIPVFYVTIIYPNVIVRLCIFVILATVCFWLLLYKIMNDFLFKKFTLGKA